jgi:hypothetical protein
MAFFINYSSARRAQVASRTRESLQIAFPTRAADCLGGNEYVDNPETIILPNDQPWLEQMASFFALRECSKQMMDGWARKVCICPVAGLQGSSSMSSKTALLAGIHSRGVIWMCCVRAHAPHRTEQVPKVVMTSATVLPASLPKPVVGRRWILGAS